MCTSARRGKKDQIAAGKLQGRICGLALWRGECLQSIRDDGFVVYSTNESAIAAMRKFGKVQFDQRDPVLRQNIPSSLVIKPSLLAPNYS